MKRTNKEEKAETWDIPTPEEVLDPEGEYTRSDLFDFSVKGNGKVNG